MADEAPRDTDEILEELRAWAIARALPETEDEWDKGYETLRSKLSDWIDERS